MAKNKITTILLSIVIALFILSGSIACPILIRGLYYSQIDRLNIPETSGYSVETIREAFDEMMDYCTGGGEDAGLTFGTGTLSWSESGKAHFDDVEKLFGLDISVLKITAVIIIAFIIIRIATGRKNYISPHRFLRRGPLFWGPAILLTVFAIVGAAASRDFDAFFVKFHHMFFPGKDNWVFDPAEDEIIKILPEEVFMNFAIVILAVLIIACALCIILDFVIGKNKKSVN